jgi:DNA helicase-2/ATP-dependent DNA helicase PcrA
MALYSGENPAMLRGVGERFSPLSLREQKVAFSPSPQQQAVFDFVSHGNGSAVVVAVAGAGKTTTLVHALGKAKGTVTFTAFNKKIADEIKARVDAAYPGENRFRIGTFHSLGFGMIRKIMPTVKVDENARRDDLTHPLEENQREITWKLFNYARQRGVCCLWQETDQSQWYDIWQHFSMDEELPDDGSFQVKDVITNAILLCAMAAQKTKIIDYTDMLWLPLVWKLRPWQTDWIFVDESQDTNPCRRALAHLMLKHNGRAVFVGDPCQAIFGFTGADSDAIDLIRKEFNAVELPLTTTYRCPKTVVSVANQWVSHIHAADTAPEGQVVRTGNDKPWFDGVQPGEAILCRNTKPLVELAFRFIRQGRPAFVEGRDIGRGLISLTNKWKVSDVDTFLDRLETWKEKQVAKLTAKGQGLAVQALEDRVETLRVLSEGCETIKDLQKKISSIFDDTKDGNAKHRITLSTIHKSKGLEWEKVNVFGMNKYQPSPYARQAWELEQENSLCYVAVTRAQDKLVMVSVS